MKELLRADGISKTYEDGRHVLGDISITLNEGEIVSLLGVSGVGKSTLFNIMSGLIMPDHGTVTLDGEDITGKTGSLSYMLQKDLLLPHLKVLDNVALPLLLSGMRKAEARAKAKSLFGQFGLTGTEDKYPIQLSGGMRQRAAFLRTYLCGKKVVLLDEPFGALDTITRSSMHDWYLEIMNDIKLSTILITHDIDEAILLSDRIYIMKGTPAVISDEIIIDEAKPRDPDFVLTEEFLSYKRKIKGLLL